MLQAYLYGPQKGGSCRLQSSYGTATFQAWLGRGRLEASGSLWGPLGTEPLANKIGNMTFKKEAPVDYSLRMEWLLFRLGWVEGFWKPLGLFFKCSVGKNDNSLVHWGVFEHQN